jgi:hypothetical protein
MKSTLKYILRQDSGFGLVGALIAAAVGLIIVGGLVESILTMMHSQTSVQMSAEGLLIGDQIQVALESEGQCGASLSTALHGLPLDLTTPGGMPLTLPIKIGDQNLTLAADTMITPNLKLKTLNLVPVQLAGASALNTPPQNPVLYNMSFTPITPALRYKMKLVYTTEKNAGSYAPQSQPHEVIINVVAEQATHLFLGCVAENDDTKACEQMGGIWNPLGTDGKRCVSLQNCDWGGSYGVVSPANLLNGIPNVSFKNQVTNDFTCPTEFSPVQTGAISSAQRYGKKGVKNINDPIYSCLRCGAPNLTAAAAITAFDLGTAISDGIQDLSDSEDSNAAKANANIVTGDGIITTANANTVTTNADTDATNAGTASIP